MTSTSTLCGTVNKFLFQDISSGYAVFELENNGSIAVVKGTFPSVHVGQDIEVAGAWINDPRYGRQFQAASCRTQIPKSVIGLKRFLGSGLIKGIGKVYAEKLVDHFGENVLSVIEKSPEQLSKVPGLGPKRIEAIAGGLQEHKEVAEVMVFLQEKSISPAIAMRLYKQYRQNTIPVIMQNPYRLAEELWGVGFKTADDIAQKIGFAKNSPHRIMSGIQYALSQAMQQGHLYVEVSELKKNVHALLELPQDNDHVLKIKRELHHLYDQDKIKLVSQAEHHFIGLTKCYKAEHGIADKLKTLSGMPSRYGFDIHHIYSDLANDISNDIQLNEQQIKGILTALQQKITIITGGPGTGKTTLIKKLLSILEHKKIDYRLAAPTGRAAKRIAEGTGRFASTIHRLLEFDPLTMQFKHNDRNTLSLDFLIVDEASMIDVFLAHSLLKAIPVNAHVIFLGDTDQLPAVGAGNFLRDCIASNKVACIRLTEIFRQAQDSLIIVNAHRVNKGEFPVTFLPGAKRDFLFIKENDATQLPRHLADIYKKTLPTYYIASDDAMVLTPMNRGTAGTQILNHHLQTMLNPGQQDHVMFNGIMYKVGDRVMQIRNNYDKFVFNGDMGIITQLSSEDKMLSVSFGQRVLDYDFSDLNELILAYAISVHKSQGSEYSAAIVPVFVQHFTLLQRNLIYTAITRAKKLCILIGESKALAIALRNAKDSLRITFLRTFLES